MSTKIKKTFCTMFKRTEGEKRQAAMSAELEETKKELAEVKEILNRLISDKDGSVVSSPKSRKNVK